MVKFGAADPIELDVSRARIAEVEAAIEAFQKKIGIRQNFLNRKANAAVTELRTLEVEAEQRQKTLGPKVELAQKQAENAAANVRIGQASNLDKAEATLRAQELETELAKAELDLARVRQQLEKRRGR
jgi:multidrug efflux pump subunit AcrA (membrane-fusion protein)